MPNAVYNIVKLALATGELDLVDDTIKILLVTDSYTPDIDTHTHLDDVTNEVVGAGYTAGGQALANQDVDVDLVNDRAFFDANDVTWATSSITARGVIIYKDTGVAATSTLITYLDFGTNRTSDGGDFTVVFDATGILRLQ